MSNAKRTYSIYTLVYKTRAGTWADLEGHGCWRDEAEKSAAEWASKGVTVALKVDTYAHGKTLTPPVATQIEQVRR